MAYNYRDDPILGPILAYWVDNWQDVFRAAGYTHEEVDVCTKVVRKRIAELLAL